MTIPNFSNQYDDLSAVESDPRWLRLCAQQMRELSKITSKFAQERVRLGLAIAKEARAVCECNGGAACACPDCDHADCAYQQPVFDEEGLLIDPGKKGGEDTP